jgi:hypothetical protein
MAKKMEKELFVLQYKIKVLDKDPYKDAGELK